MELPVPFEHWHEHLAVELPGARAVFTTRRGGHSTGPYASLNLGRLTDDDPEAVERNRSLVESRVGGRLAMIRQVHGSRVLRPELLSSSPGADPHAVLEEADGQLTTQAGIVPMVLTADCLPIAVAGAGAVAVVHAGWRGLAAGVIAEAVRGLREFVAKPPLDAAIGPGAGACCYEVGEEVHAHFQSVGSEARRGRNLDLKAIARRQLEQAGVRNVFDAGLCTICSPDSLFFSHRRDRGLTGRQAGLAWLT